MPRPVFERNAVKRAGIFGSYVKNEANANRDIDFVVDMEGSLFKLCGLVDELENTLYKHWDVLTFRGLEKDGGRLAQEIQRGVQVVY